MANRFLNNIRINDEYTFPVNDGSAGQAIVTDGSGNLSFGSAIASSADSTESVHISVKNTSGSQILKGTPVYVTGETGNSGKIEIAPADASNSAKMPALGILESTLSNNAEGFCVQGGLLEGLATATIDGTSTTANDTVYVKAGGGLTMTKPTGSNLIQNIAKVARVHASNGSLVVSSILRTNDVPNLTTGKIWVGQGNTIESTVVHLDETNGRMGVGTTSPGAKLEVAGTGALSFKINNTQYSRSLIIQQGGGYSHLKASHVSGIAINYGQGNPGILSLFNNTTQAVKINTNGNSYFNGGNVGIGTTSPDLKLHLAHSDSNNGLLLEHTSQANGFQILQNIRETEGLIWQKWTNGSFTSNLMTLDYSGNVGIGTTSPSKKLTVYGGNDNGIWVDSSGSQYTSIAWGNNGTEKANIAYDNTNANFVLSAYGASDTVFSNNGSERMRINSAGNVGIGTTSPLHDLQIGTAATNGSYSMMIEGNFANNALASNPRLNLIDTNFGITAGKYGSGSADDALGIFGFQGAGRGILFAHTTAGSGTHLKDMRHDMFVDGGTGNVGIGTTSPQATLHISKGSNDSPTVMRIENVDTTIETNQEVNTIQFYSNDASSSGTGITSKIAQVAENPGNLYGLSFYTYALGLSEALRIKNNGNVGIGTTSPSRKLSVAGDVVLGQGQSRSVTYRSADGNFRITPNNGGWSTGYFFDNYSGTYKGGFGALGSGDSLTYFWIGDNYNDTTMVLEPNAGNVGIGTTSPSSKLDVVAGNNNGVRIAAETSNNTWKNIKILSYVDESQAASFSDGSHIYTTSPSNATEWPFTEYGALVIEGRDNGNGGIALRTGNGSGQETRIAIREDGNVGIGTTSPSQKLDVSGNIKMTETAATTDTDKFVVLDSGVLKYRTGAEVRSDIGAGTGDITGVTAGTYLTGGGTSGNVTINADSTQLAHIHDSSNGTVAAGWITVAQASGARKAGEIYVTDGESSDHSYIRIEWMRSYADSNFTVLNCGGHANRIVGVRVLEETADKTYGKKYIQVKVTTTSNYYVIVTAPGSIPMYGDFTAETPVLENTKTGYNVKGSQLENLQESSVGTDQGITVGGDLFVDGNAGIGTTSPAAKLHVSSGNSDTTHTIHVDHTRNDPDTASNAVFIDANYSGTKSAATDTIQTGLKVDLDSSATGTATDEHRVYGIHSDTRNSSFADFVFGTYSYAESNYTGGKTAYVGGVYGLATHDANSASGGVSQLFGVKGAAQIQDDGDVDSAYGGQFQVLIANNRDANVDVTVGVEAEIQIDEQSALTYGDMHGFRAIIDNNEGTVPTFGNQYLFKGDYQGTKGSNAYGIYIEGDKHYFDGNVGIGTTSPGNKLHIVGNTAKLQGSDSVYTAWFITNSGTGNAGTYYDAINGDVSGGDYGFIGQNNSGYMEYWIGANSPMPYHAFTSGNVGIGTTSPTHLLTLETASSPGLKIKDTTQGATLLAFSQDSNSHIGTYSSHPLVLDTNSSERMRITEAGNVGIGTTSPSGLLDVSNGTNSIFIESGGTYPELNADVVLRIGQRTEIWGDGTGRHYLDVRDPNGNQNIKLNGEGNSFFSNNLGIGTTSPGQKLEVNGNIKMTETAATTDTDKFVVLDSGVLKYRTGAQVLSDIGAAASSHNHDDRYYTETESDARYVQQGGTSFSGEYPIVVRVSDRNFYSDGNIKFRGSDSRLTVDGSVASPIFYDSDNTSYYVNPASTSTINNLTTAGLFQQPTNDEYFVTSGKQVTSVNDAWSMNIATSKNAGLQTFRFQNGVTGAPSTNDNANWGINIYSHSGSGGGYPYGVQLAGGNNDNQAFYLRRFSNGSAQTWRRIFHEGSSDLRAPIFYDSDDTNYYADPASTTTSAALAGRITIGQLNTANSADNWSIKLIENSGNCYIGNHNGTAQIQAGGYLPNATGTTIQLDAGTQLYSGVWAAPNGKIHLVTAYSATYGGTPNYDIGFTMNDFGRVGIGTTIPAYQLQLSTNSAAKPTSSAWTVVSDERVKTNIRPYETGLQELLQIEPKVFDYNGKAGFDAKIKNNIGIIAQEVKDIIPETVKTYEAKLNENDEENTELYNFDGHALTFALINSVKELSAKIESLETKIQTLENQ